jgi:RNA polymerase sigma-70 factor (ECF subfamily)
MQKQDKEMELIARSLNGDSHAYGALIDRYKNALYRHCFAIVRNEDVAEDIAQETFITAYYKLHTYNSSYRLSTWLFKIATNKALTWLKKASREVRANDELIARIASHHPGPDQIAQYSELRRAVENLQPKHRAVISLYYWQGLSYSEIATVLTAPIGSVKVWMRRAKQQLKKELS